MHFQEVGIRTSNNMKVTTKHGWRQMTINFQNLLLLCFVVVVVIDVCACVKIVLQM